MMNVHAGVGVGDRSQWFVQMVKVLPCVVVLGLVALKMVWVHCGISVAESTVVLFMM